MREEARDERKVRIVEAARRAFSSADFDGAAMGEIAKSAGMAAGTLYNYFPSKESLLLAVFEAEIAELGSAGRTPRSVGEWARSAFKRYARFPRERWREFMAAFYRGSPEDGLKSYSTQAPLLDSLGLVLSSSLSSLGSEAAGDQRLRRILFSIYYQGFLRWLNAGRDLEEVVEEVVGDLEALVEAWRRPMTDSARLDAGRRLNLD